MDFPDLKQAQKQVEVLFPEIKFFKVGLELFLAAGWQAVDYILEQGGKYNGAKVMLDLKFLDIPNTVAKAIKQVEGQGREISLITVHAHSNIIEAAIRARQNPNMKILAVTMLTSFSQKDMREFTGYTNNQLSPSELVDARAQISLDAGSDGLVASPWEAQGLRAKYGNDFILLTPGIRLNNNEEKNDDQVRIATPRQAVLSGADYLVIGRPITKSLDPLSLINKIKSSLN